MQEETATPLSLQSIDQWGSIEWKTMAGAFKGCINMVYNATDIPDLSQVESMVSMFYGATSFNGDIGGWDLGNTVDNISGMFEGATSFNQDISGWDVSLVSFMGNLFNGASSFNQNLENWQVLSLKNSISFVGSGMSAQNYSSTIIGWAAQQVNQNVQVFASDINYCDDYDSIDAWNTLSNPNIFNWTVQHAGYVSCQ
jgi:surface protein